MTSPTPLSDPLHGLTRLLVHGPGLASVSTLAPLLQPLELVPSSRYRDPDGGATGVLAWGRKPSAERAQSWAAAQKLPLRWIEDGFLRSIDLGDAEPPLSIVVDDLGIYYDAGAWSRLEQLIAEPMGPEALHRAAGIQTAWRAARASKYNHAREQPGALQDGDVLVIDQTAGDASIGYGWADAASFQRMLTAALDEHPQARIVLKVHPDVLAGRKSGHFQRLTAGEASRVMLLAADAHAPGLLERAAAVYTVTSQMGFEGLLWGRPVRCFGMPFYAGYGLTQDDKAAPPRRSAAPLQALVHAALVRYPRYLDPETRQPCEVERLLDWVGLQRRMRERFPPDVTAIGFSRWKKPIVRAFFAGSRVHFASPRRPVPSGHALALWGRRAASKAVRESAPALTVRLEDGFLRSVGLGAELVRPLSWVLDRSGMYYDASGPSDLEKLLQQGDFAPALCARARALRERILALGLTKYNVGRASWRPPAQPRKLVLVVGQVEDDAAVAYGAPGIRTNLALLQAVRAREPQAYLIYKPHPDVVARLRERGQGEQLAADHCDEVVIDVPMDRMLTAVDEVHVLTSLAGFEALLRGKPVVTWGLPFYAHWGLTTDLAPLPRRTRRLTLDELVAGVLILYPTYVSRITGRYATAERALEELDKWRRTATRGNTGLRRRLWRWAMRWARSLRAWKADRDAR